MTDYIKDGRLPSFTPEDSEMVTGSYDFIGVNHYSSSYVMDNPTGQQGNWITDMKTSSTRIGIDGKPIGPRA